jgi:sec-independent protein translocase protein TatA
MIGESIMGLGGINIWQLLIILAIVVVLFGTKKLRGMGGDLGGALKGFKKAMSDDEKQSESLQNNTQSKNNTESDKKKDKV